MNRTTCRIRADITIFQLAKVTPRYVRCSNPRGTGLANTARAATPRRAQYPSHEYADQHKAIRARDELVTSRRRLRDAAELRACAEVACERIREFGWDLGAEAREAHPNTWYAAASRALGLHEHTGWAILAGRIERVSSRTVDAVARHTGVPVRVFLDPEL